MSSKSIMMSVIAPLDDRSYEQVEALRMELNKETGATYTTVQPHITLHAAENYWNLSAVIDALDSLLRTISPFRVRTASLGVYTGDLPVLVLPVLQSSPLSSLQSAVNRVVSPHCQPLSHAYEPNYWLPYVTVLHKPSPTALGKSVEYLAWRKLELNISINRIRLDQRIGSEFRTLYERQFGSVGMSPKG